MTLHDGQRYNVLARGRVRCHLRFRRDALAFVSHTMTLSVADVERVSPADGPRARPRFWHDIDDCRLAREAA